MGIPLSGISATLGVPPVGDQANAVISGAFAGTGTSDAFVFYGSFNVVIYGTWAATVQLERSFDGGVTWVVCGVGGSGAQAVWSTGADISISLAEFEKGVAYRLHCSAYTSGAPTYRMSATGVLATSNGIPA